MRNSTMDTAQESSTLLTLQRRRQALRRELFHVQKQIDQVQRAQARLEERIQILEQGQRQAA